MKFNWSVSLVILIAVLCLVSLPSISEAKPISKTSGASLTIEKYYATITITSYNLGIATCKVPGVPTIKAYQSKYLSYCKRDITRSQIKTIKRSMKRNKIPLSVSFYNRRTASGYVPIGFYKLGAW